MANVKTVHEVMRDVFEYPHIPYWFSLRQAVGIMRKAVIDTEKCVQPQVILVFDEKYNLTGTLTIRDILRGLEPKFLQSVAEAQVPEQDESGLSVIWEALFNGETMAAAERPVSEVMVAAKLFMKPDEPITKAAYLMVHNNLVVLPVLEDRKKFVGVVRMVEIFNELSDAVLASRQGG